jgi:hypothetical protein
MVGKIRRRALAAAKGHPPLSGTESDSLSQST